MRAYGNTDNPHSEILIVIFVLNGNIELDVGKWIFFNGLQYMRVKKRTQC